MATISSLCRRQCQSGTAIVKSKQTASFVVRADLKKEEPFGAGGATIATISSRSPFSFAVLISIEQQQQLRFNLPRNEKRDSICMLASVLRTNFALTNQLTD